MKSFKKIGRYEIQGIIAEGAMAVVYKARDPEIDRTVAIKVLKDELGVDEEHVGRFLREAKAAGSFSHPNIVTIYDVGCMDDTFYITMEFLNRKSLADVLTENRSLPPEQVLSIGIQLAKALDAAHRKGIVHRDIKPGNILFADEKTVKIADFGIAWLDRPDDPEKADAGMVAGTPRYMSPEQAAGRDADGRSDLFSLGAILYELVSGKKAFDSNNVPTLMLQISLKNPTPLSALVPGISESLQRIILKLLNKIPEQRFQSAADVVDALERELALMAQEARRQSQRAIPLRMKFAALAGGLTALFAAISMAVVCYLESRDLESQLLDSGASLTKAIATQTAAPLLGRDWLPLELLVADERARNTFDYLVVTDRQNVVRAATDKAMVGKIYAPPPAPVVPIADPDVTASSMVLPEGEAAFLFDTQILFQKREIGRLYLGMSKANIQSVVQATFLVMSVLGMIAALAAAGTCFLFGNLVARAMRVLRESMAGVGAGELDRRVLDKRNDEIGEVFAAFNHMVESLAKHQHGNGNGKSAMLPVPDAERLAALEAADDAEATMLIATEPAARGSGAKPAKSAPVDKTAPDVVANAAPAEAKKERASSRKRA